MTDMRMEFEQVEDMIAAFRRAADRFEELISNLQQAVNLAQGGALVGQKGDQMVTAIDSALLRKVDNGRVKFLEMSSDLNAAMEAMRGSDHTSGRYFS